MTMEARLVTRIGIPYGFIRLGRDSLGVFPLQCYRQVEDYLGLVRTTYHTGAGNPVPVQHILYMPSGSVLGNTKQNLQHRPHSL